ncbi:SLC13 family permease [Enterococcus sp.]|uniref:SLC13 family permease n=1 Tax=Enterococcus sp. TaxID=35783 RepID=UPI00289D3E97|nr:SLC13 family permease [Enterococcus sp.]
MKTRLIGFFKSDLLFTLSLILALVTCLTGRFSWSFIDYKVIFSLFGLMLVINGLEHTGLLHTLGQTILQKSQNLRTLIRSIVLLSFFSSMLLTNDVAILTLLPMYIMLTRGIQERSSVLLGAVYLTAAANMGSSLFPFGNPQNLFLFSYYAIPLPRFLATTATFVGLSLLALLLLIQLLPKKPLTIRVEPVIFKKKETTVYSGLLLVMILGIFGLLPMPAAVGLTAAVIFFQNKQLFVKVDYLLLLTFVFFFLIVGNIQAQTVIIDTIQPYFQESHQALIGSILLSQVISNVPAAILIAPFTTLEKALLLGVNLGGLGTLIASLANLIAYKLIKQALPHETKQYQKRFYLVNTALLITVAAVVYILL